MARPKEFETTKILNRAVDYFWTFGYEGSSMQGLLKHLGIGRQSLYDTFGGKHDLFFASLKQYALQYDLVHILEKTESGKEAIFRTFDEVIRTVSIENQSKGCFLVNTAVELGPRDPEILKFIETGRENLENSFYHALTRAQKQGELNGNNHDLMGVAKFLNNSRMGLVVTAKSTSDLNELQHIVRTTLSMVFD